MITFGALSSNIHLANLKNRPSINALDTFICPEVDISRASNDVPIYQIHKQNAQVVLVDIVFKAGRLQEQKQMAASCTAALLSEGTTNRTSQQIAEYVDYHGATLRVRSDFDTTSIKLLSMTKHFDKLTGLLEEVLTMPLFSLEELELIISRRKERLKMDLQKNDIISYRRLTESLFGYNHPYGYNSAPDKYDLIEQSDLINHHTQLFSAQNCSCFVAGDISPDIVSRLKTVLSSLPTGEEYVQEKRLPKQPSSIKKNVIRGNPLQTSIRMGRHCFSRNHPDYHNLLMANTILGGYFGSRLISNIREDKGFTYGIYSMLDTHIAEGSLMISTDVDKSNVQQTITEINIELDRMCQEKVPDDELNLVRNYVSGMYINFFDGPLNSIKAIKTLALNNIHLDELKSLLDIYRSITAEEILDTSQQYFNRNDFWTVTVG
jgi:predicted Zn-dependent peptidase